MHANVLSLSTAFGFLGLCEFVEPFMLPPQLEYKKYPAPDSHRCGICPTYLQKVCAFNFLDNSTYIFDNHCIMDLYNCMEGTEYIAMNYEKCLYFGNFAYVHGFSADEEFDYGESHFILQSSKKNPDFAK